MPSNERWLPALDDRPGPAAPIAEARANAMVDAAIGAALAPVPSPVPRPRLVRFAKPLAYGMAAALVTAAAIAGAVAWSHRVSRTVVAPAAPSPAPTESALSSTPLPGPSALPLPQTSEAPPAPAVSSPVHARAPSSEVADLLARANDLRAARRWKDASLAYEHVASAHPGSPEAYAAEVAAADLRLEQLRDPAGALRLYRAARSTRGSGGALGEQILWGIARCMPALGDARGEEAAIREYLARYPNGLFAPEARERQTQLARP